MNMPKTLRKRTKKNNSKIKLKKNHLLEAVDMISSRDSNSVSISNAYQGSKERRIINLCSYEFTIPNGRRQNVQVMPTNTQLLLSQLRLCILQHKWPEAARCVYYMLNMNRRLLPIIWKSLMLIVFNNPEVRANELDDFLRTCLGLRTADEKLRFLQHTLTLPKDLKSFSRQDKMSLSMFEDNDDDDDNNNDSCHEDIFP